MRTAKNILILLFLALSSFSYAAESGHISDSIKVFIHGGPSNQYRIIGRISSGDSVTILERNSETGYVKIKLENNVVGWVEGRNIKKGESLMQRLPSLEKSLEKSQQTVLEQRTVLDSLRIELSDVRSERNELAQQMEQLQSEIKTLNFKIETMDQTNLLRWFTHGGLVALGGVILGLLARYFPGRKKQSSSW